MGEPQVLRQLRDQLRHLFSPGAIEHFEHGYCRHDAVVITAADRRIEEIMTALLEARESLEFRCAPLDVGMAGLPVIGHDAA